MRPLPLIAARRWLVEAAFPNIPRNSSELNEFHQRGYRCGQGFSANWPVNSRGQSSTGQAGGHRAAKHSAGTKRSLVSCNPEARVSAVSQLINCSGRSADGDERGGELRGIPAGPREFYDRTRYHARAPGPGHKGDAKRRRSRETAPGVVTTGRATVNPGLIS